MDYKITIKQMIADGVIPQEVAAKYFPELKESEDERIREALLEHIKGIKSWEYFLGISKEQMIAWLEKQGEKDNISIDFVLGYLGIKPAYKDGNAWCILLGDNIQEGICGFGDTKEEALIAFIKELIEKQGKKKPTIVDIMKNYFATTPKEQQDKDWEELKHLNNFGWEVVEQNPAWSEYDCMMIESIIQTLEITGDKGANRMKIDFLKSLKSRVQPQPRQEWSEEDKRSIRDSIFYLKSAKKYFEKDDDILWDEKWFNLCIEFLEALYKKLQPQPQWKPSKEQIGALEHFVRSIAESGYASPHNNNTKLVYSLLSELKKLKIIKL